MKITDFLSRKHKPIVDLQSLCTIFTNNPLKQECYRLLIEEVASSKQPYFLNTFRRKYAKEERYKDASENKWMFHCPMISEVWKSCFELGILQRKRRGGEVRLSKKFSSMLQSISEYWTNYVEAKKA